MPLKSILLSLDETKQSETRLAFAAALARRHGAHLCGLMTVAIPEVPPGVVVMGGYGDRLGGLAVVDAIRLTATAEAERVKEAFWETARREALSAEWRFLEGPASWVLPVQARCFDLVVVGQPDPDGLRPEADRAALAAALLASGRPVLAVPYAGSFDRPIETVTVGWNGSREAARAVHDALPLLQQARTVTVLTVEVPVGGQIPDEIPGAEIAHQLARHGVNAVAARTVSGTVGEGIALLNQAADDGADLVVMGGYGHSRAREFLFGGVTRTLVASMTVPVLMSH